MIQLLLRRIVERMDHAEQAGGENGVEHDGFR
jgi:hypothetical protein